MSFWVSIVAKNNYRNMLDLVVELIASAAEENSMNEIINLCRVIDQTHEQLPQ